jgi:2-oxoglutarate dehydrogenase E1 component
MTNSSARDTYLASANGAFVEELYQRYLADPSSVDAEWARFFAAMDDDAGSVAKELNGASWSPSTARVIGNGESNGPAEAPLSDISTVGTPSTGTPTNDVRAATNDSIQALMLIRSHRVRGHLYSKLDPLGLEKPAPHTELDPATYGFTAGDSEREIYLHNRFLGLEKAKLRKIVQALRETYCGTVGIEYMHITSAEEKTWIQDRIEEIHNRTEFTGRGKAAILERLAEAEGLEKFLHTRYPGTKRFGLDGGEALIPALEQILKRGSQLGIEEVVIGMPHRGRLNVLAHVLNKPYAAIFSEFQGASNKPEEVQGSGDVKYHLGTSADREFDGTVVHLSLAANPSHLEAVNPVVVGKVRAKQRQRGDKERRRVLGILMHGDAAFAGQGIVNETFDLSDIRGYRTGGTIHLVVNNQIGFTTNPGATRNSRYPTDVAKAAEAPIFHVNGDDVEAVIHVTRIATEFRQTFQKDVVIDIWCYRRFGHNEGDEPAFTQPLMYQAIARHPTVCSIYADKLTDEGSLSPAEVEAIEAECRSRLDEGFEGSKGYKPNKADWLEGEWSDMTTAPTMEERRGKTDVAIDRLREIGEALVTVPDAFNLNPKLERFLGGRRLMMETGEGIDWSMAEALAFGTLLREGAMVRLSGQDCGRGTFSQRHAVLTDQETEQKYISLYNLGADQARFVVRDSPLSEVAVLGFEYGMSLADPSILVLWEAQFGDFSNGAQFIIDQFISSGESKWLRMSGLVMLLPHGYEGQGPEHSSARLERYLQLCGEDNIQVANITSPANYFHVLRRQINRNFRKPLIVMTPKSLLRHKLCVSPLADMGPGSTFRRVLPDPGGIAADGAVRRVVLCSGKVFYDLLAERSERGIDDVALVRLEQLYPFPVISLGAELARYVNAEVVWCQEEPRNMGSWTFVDRRLEELLGQLEMTAERPRYAGRDEAASPATGSHAKHVAEQKKLIDEALSMV